jgi:phage antirepressor YoqD-like protein
MNELTNKVRVVTTLKELSALWKIDESTIRRIVKELFPDLLKNGVTTYISEQQSAIIKEKLLINKRIDTSVLKVEVTTEADDDLIIIRGLEASQRKIIKLQKEIEILKPKALFFDTVADSKTAIEMGIVAKTIDKGYGRNDLFEILRIEKILMANNIPYQKYIDMEYFRVIEQRFSKPDGSICVNTKTLVYQKGIDFIIRVLEDLEKNGVK